MKDRNLLPCRSWKKRCPHHHPSGGHSEGRLAGGHLPCGGKIGFVYRQQPYLLRQHRARKADAVQDACFRGSGTFFTVSDIHAQPGGAIHAVSTQFDRLDFIVCLGTGCLTRAAVRPIPCWWISWPRSAWGELPVVYVRGNLSFWERKRNASRRISRRPTANFVTHWHTTTPIF